MSTVHYNIANTEVVYAVRIEVLGAPGKACVTCVMVHRMEPVMQLVGKVFFL